MKNRLAVSILISGVTGLFASWMISAEKLDIIKNPLYVAPCDLNPLFNCGIVMRSIYSTQILFGYPNSWLGLMMYPCAIMLGLFLIFAENHNKNLLRFCNLLPFLAFCLSCYWIYLQGYVIGAICIWCLLSAISSTLIFISITKYNILHDNPPFKFMSKLRPALEKDWDIPFIYFGLY
jgi:uncharacterized membrane protein